MRWLLRCVLALWIIMLAVCGAVALVVRLNREPGPLQALGFDVCDGEPCFRGIKVGMDWAEVPKRLPTVTKDGRFFLLPVNAVGIGNVTFRLSLDGAKVEAIYAISPLIQPVNLLMPGTMVALYGPPCRVVLIEENGMPYGIDMRYAAIVVRYRTIAVLPQLDVRLQADTHGYELWIEAERPELCEGITENSGPWRGFTSAKAYRAGNRRALAAK